MSRIAPSLLTSVVVLATVAAALAEDTPTPAASAVTDIADAGPEFAVQGEYVGELKIEGELGKYAAQITALGNGKFHSLGYYGGLPGEGWDESNLYEADGQIKDGAVVFTHPNGITGTIRLDAKDADGKAGTDGILTIKGPQGGTRGTLKKISRTSPTLGEKSPAGAIVLFDGTSTDAFIDGRVKDGLLLAGATSKQKFQSFKIHLEFLVPFAPTARGQDRGNSGFYAQGRYETHILDSFGLVSQKDDAAAIFGIAPPRLNLSYPPLAWQTYDIDFTAAKFEDGKKVKNAHLTVRHNGVVVQKDREVKHATSGAPLEEGSEPGPIHLQDRGSPVRFRNIWLVETGSLPK